jgi:hypothetical protein
VVSFTPRPLYPQGKSPRHPLDRRLGERWRGKSWKILHNEELQNLYASSIIIIIIIIIIMLSKSRRMRWAGHLAGMGEMRNAYNILAGKCERKRSLGRSRHR